MEPRGVSLALIALLLLAAGTGAAMTVHMGGDLSYSLKVPASVPPVDLAVRLDPRNAPVVGSGMRIDAAGTPIGNSLAIDLRSTVAAADPGTTRWLTLRAIDETQHGESMAYAEFASAPAGARASRCSAWGAALRAPCGTVPLAALDPAKEALWGESGLLPWVGSTNVDPSQLPPFENGMPDKPGPLLPPFVTQHTNGIYIWHPRYQGLDGKEHDGDDFWRGRGFATGLPSDLDPAFAEPDLPWNDIETAARLIPLDGALSEAANLAPETALPDPIEIRAPELGSLVVAMPDSIEPVSVEFRDVDLRLSVSSPAQPVNAIASEGNGEVGRLVEGSLGQMSDSTGAFGAAFATLLPLQARGNDNAAGSSGPFGDALHVGAAAVATAVEPLPVQLLLLAAGGAALPAWALYRRIVQGRALDNAHRRRVFEAVRTNPGVSPAALRRATGLHYTTCAHHLRVLQELGLVELRRFGGQIRCFERGRGYDELERSLHAALRSEPARGLLQALLRSPGLTLTQAASSLGRPKTSLKYHVDRLCAWNLVQAEPQGRSVALRLEPRMRAKVQVLLMDPAPLAKAPVAVTVEGAAVP